MAKHELPTLLNQFDVFDTIEVRILGTIFGSYKLEKERRYTIDHRQRSRVEFRALLTSALKDLESM